MENIGASVDAVSTQGKKTVAVVAEEEECHQMRNEMVFFIKRRPSIEYQPWRSGVKTPEGIY